MIWESVRSSALLTRSAALSPDRLIRISRGPSSRKENPRAGVSNWKEETPRSSTTPSLSSAPLPLSLSSSSMRENSPSTKVRRPLKCSRDFLGHPFLHDAAVVPYQLEGAKVRLFAIEGRDASDVQTMIQRYRVAAKSPASQVEKAGGATLKDPLNGEVILRWDGRWLWGAVDYPPSNRQVTEAVQARVDELGKHLLSARQ